METTEYTSYNTCGVNESHFFWHSYDKVCFVIAVVTVFAWKVGYCDYDRVWFVASHTGFEWGSFSLVSSITLVFGLPWLWTQIAMMTTFLISLHLGYTD